VATSPPDYLYESPFGLIPCPTLSVVAGLSIAARALDSHAWRWTVSMAALFYGVIGALVLQVPIDVVLIAAGVILAWRGLVPDEGAHMKTITILAAIGITAGIAAPASAQSTIDASPAVAAFVDATRDYSLMHRRIERLLDPIAIDANAISIQRSSDAMATAIRAGRSGAQQGDLFTPELGRELRARINIALLEHGVTPADIRAEELRDGIDPSTAALRVNGQFPWRIASAMLPCVINALPPLPSELQYRIVDDALVLVDVHASLIVDILPHALIELTISSRDRGKTHHP
jgi:hypothetical protein